MRCELLGDLFRTALALLVIEHVNCDLVDLDGAGEGVCVSTHFGVLDRLHIRSIPVRAKIVVRHDRTPAVIEYLGRTLQRKMFF